MLDVIMVAGWCRVVMDWGNAGLSFGTYHLQCGHFEKEKMLEGERGKVC